MVQRNGGVGQFPTLSTPERYSNPDIPIVGSLVYCESSAIDDVFCESRIPIRAYVPVAPRRSESPPDDATHPTVASKARNTSRCGCIGGGGYVTPSRRKEEELSRVRGDGARVVSCVVDSEQCGLTKDLRHSHGEKCRGVPWYYSYLLKVTAADKVLLVKVDQCYLISGVTFTGTETFVAVTMNLSLVLTYNSSNNNNNNNNNSYISSQWLSDTHGIGVKRLRVSPPVEWERGSAHGRTSRTKTERVMGWQAPRISLEPIPELLALFTDAMNIIKIRPISLTLTLGDKHIRKSKRRSLSPTCWLNILGPPLRPTQLDSACAEPPKSANMLGWSFIISNTIQHNLLVRTDSPNTNMLSNIPNKLGVR
uniref:Uncharacterized protein n=1 Tax=Timema tahoe TaxID=61484 RepID=A0A7R9IB04_9NEOP|nr:unnamed protein product [Timema tahoe]